MKSGLIIGLVILALVVVGAFFYLSQPSTNNQYSNNENIVINNNSGVIVNNEAGQTNNSTTTLNQPETLNIEIKGFAFVPATIEINVGDTIIWTNKDSASHTVTSDSGNELSSQYLSRNSQYSHTFTTAGEYDYHCTPHPYMKGKIIVR